MFAVDMAEAKPGLGHAGRRLSELNDLIALVLVQHGLDGDAGLSVVGVVADHKIGVMAVSRDHAIQDLGRSKRADDQRGEKAARGDVSAAQDDTHGRGRPDACPRGDANELATGLNNCSGAEETNTGDDLGGDSASIAAFASQEDRRLSEYRRAEADEDHRPEAGGFLGALALDADDGAADHGGDGADDARPVTSDDVVNVTQPGPDFLRHINVVGKACRKAQGRWLRF